MKKGFTLIELLAVIVILAIIALIATPIVLDIIEDSKNSSRKRSQELYVESLNQAVARKQLNGEILSDGVYSIKELEATIKGEIPEDGYVYIKDGTVTQYHLRYKSGVVQYNLNKIELEKDILSNTDPFSISAVTLSFDETLEINFYVKKTEMDKYSDAYILIENKEKFDSTSPKQEFLKEYSEKGEYYVFTYTAICFEEFTNEQTVTLIGKSNNVEKKTQIEYNVSDYINNIIIKADTSDRSKKILVALVDFASSTQTLFKYRSDNLVKIKNPENLAYKSSYGILNEEAINLLNNLDQLSADIQNLDNAPEAFSGSIQNYDFVVSNSFSIIDAIGYNVAETKKISGVLYFSKDSYDRMMANGVDYNLMTVDSKYVKKIININTFEDKYSLADEGDLYILFNYRFNLSNAKEQIYRRTYYKDGNSYRYSDVKIVSLAHILKTKLDTVTDETKKATFTNMANLIALL